MTESKGTKVVDRGPKWGHHSTHELHALPLNNRNFSKAYAVTKRKIYSLNTTNIDTIKLTWASNGCDNLISYHGQQSYILKAAYCLCLGTVKSHGNEANPIKAHGKLILLWGLGTLDFSFLSMK